MKSVDIVCSRVWNIVFFVLNIFGFVSNRDVVCSFVSKVELSLHSRPKKKRDFSSTSNNDRNMTLFRFFGLYPSV